MESQRDHEAKVNEMNCLLYKSVMESQQYA